MTVHGGGVLDGWEKAKPEEAQVHADMAIGRALALYDQGDFSASGALAYLRAIAHARGMELEELRLYWNTREAARRLRGEQP